MISLCGLISSYDTIVTDQNTNVPNLKRLLPLRKKFVLQTAEVIINQMKPSHLQIVELVLVIKLNLIFVLFIRTLSIIQNSLLVVALHVLIRDHVAELLVHLAFVCSCLDLVHDPLEEV